ncbi:glycosyltransferase family 2 protein, partial [Streptomyces sp. NPDC048523]
PLGGGRHRVVVTGETAIDPLTLAGGRAMETGIHVVWASAQLLGVGRRARVTRSDDATRAAGSDVGFGSVRAGVRPHLVIPAWDGPDGQLRLSVRPPTQTTLPHRLYLRTTSAPPVRRTARKVLHHLPPDVRRRAKKLARRADPWSGGRR